MIDSSTPTLASALDFIVKDIDCTNLDSFLESNHKECAFVCEKLGITPLQAALFAIILEKSGDGLASTRDLIEAMEISKIRLLGYNQDLIELVKKRLILARKRRDNAYGYRVSQAIVKAVQNNTDIVPEKIEGLSTKNIFGKLHNIIAEVVGGTSSYEIALQEIYDIMNNNLENEFVKATMEKGLQSIGSSEEKFIMFYMLHRNVSFSENEFEIMEIERIIDDAFGSNEIVLDMLRSGNTEIQEKGFIEFSCTDGLENKETFQVPEKVLRELLPDLPSLSAKPKTRIPEDELIKPQDIKTKPMFYNKEEEAQIARLKELLTEENFVQVQNRLKEKGLRSGFCCLFYGPAGTGKTETVMQIAKETGREIFIVDMSRLQSKWVGDSEKNVKEVFRTYRALVKESRLAPILLFNEADALFGKRVNVENTLDKLNNTLQNIILQEMENLEGILLATTNLTQSFDSAFERRFLYKIMFNAPAASVKAKIWKSMVDEITEEQANRLASEYGFTGGQIENITRKLDVDYILSGTTPDIKKIESLCKEECIRKDNKAYNRIGF